MCINKKPKSLKVHQLSCASIKDKIYILNQIWKFSLQKLTIMTIIVF